MNNDDRAKFEALTDDLRRVAGQLRTKPTPLADAIPLLQRAADALASAQAASAELVAPCDVQMPSYWRVAVEDSEGLVLAIDQHGFTGHVDLAAREATVIGAAKHLLSFIGYGLPPSNFDPEADTTPAPAVAPADPLDTPLPCKVDLGGMSFGKGVALRTLVDAARRWREDAYGPKPSPEEAARNLALLQGAAVAPAAVTDDELRKMWRDAGGRFHGPHVETGTMPESLLLPFLRNLATRTPEPQAETASQWVEQNVSGNPVLMQAMKNHAEATEPQPDSRGQAREGQRVVTEEMVTAYLTANDAYWREKDELPTKLGKWRNGTPSEATRVSLEAALAASPTPDEQRAQAAQARVQWPKARDLFRPDDMGQGQLRVLFDSDNDVIVAIWPEGKPSVSVEFCCPGSGGGKSPRTREALIALMVAMEQDGAADRPDRAALAGRQQL